MRIAYILADAGIPVFGFKGASVHVRELIRALSRERAIHLFCASLGSERYELPVERLEVIPRPEAERDVHAQDDRDRRRLEGVERMKEVVHAALRVTPCDIIYERYSLFSDVGATLADTFRLPFVLEMNAPLIEERRRVEPLPLAPLAHEIEGRVLRRADAVLAVSEAVAAYAISAGAPAHNVHVVPNGVDTRRFHPSISGDRVRSAHGLQDRLVVGFTGSLKPWHGVDVLLRAFAQAAPAGWCLLIVGEGPERERLEALAGALCPAGEVIFTGAVNHDDIPACIAAMDIAVAPYLPVPNFYFSPLKLYEYLACGKAVIASDIGQISSAIQHGRNGYLVPPGDERALASALGYLADDVAERRRLGEAAARDVITWDQVAERTASIAVSIGARGCLP